MVDPLRTYREGDRLPVLASADLPGYSARDFGSLDGWTITLEMQRPSGVLTKAATTVVEDDGVFEFAWADDDLVAGVGQRCVVRASKDFGGVSPDVKETTLSTFVIDVFGEAP